MEPNRVLSVGGNGIKLYSNLRSNASIRMRPVGKLLLRHLNCQSHLDCHKPPGLPRTTPDNAKVSSPVMAISFTLAAGFQTRSELLADPTLRRVPIPTHRNPVRVCRNPGNQIGRAA